MWVQQPSRGVVLLLALVIALAGIPAIAAAESRSGGSVVIGPDETVADDLEIYGGTVLVAGTVDGDLEVYAGNVVVDGTVTGRVEAYAGNVLIAGQVGGDLAVYGGNVEVQPGATVDGDLEVAAGNVALDGRVGGDVSVAAESLRLGPAAAIGGDLAYDVSEFAREEGATVGGTIRPDADIEFAPPVRAPAIPRFLGAVYGFLVSLLAGAVLLGLFPTFSRAVAGRAIDRPVRAGGVGFLAIVVVPIGLLLVAITIIGLPLSIVGALLFAIAAWIGSLYGRIAVGAWLLSLRDVENRWAALVIGLLVVALASRIPGVGWLIGALVSLVGIGALALTLIERYRARRTEPGEAAPAGPAGGEGTQPA